MLFNLLRWLDASPTHYWLVAWSAFALVAALSLICLLLRPRASVVAKSSFVQCGDARRFAGVRWPMLFDNRQYPDPDESQFIAGR